MKSLKSKILIYFIFLGVIPVIVASSFILYQAYESKLKSISYHQKKIAQHIKEEINFTTSKVEKLASFISDKYKLKKDLPLRGVMRLNNNIESLLIINKQNKVVFSRYRKKTDIKKGFDYSKEPTYQQFKHLKKETMWTSVYKSLVSKQATVSYIYKMQNDDTLILSINLESINRFIKKFKSEYSKFYLTRITDKYGTFIAHPGRPDFVKKGKSIVKTDIYKKYILKKQLDKPIIFYGRNTKENIGLFTIDEKLKWIIIVKQSYDEAFRDFKKLINYILIFIVLLIILSIYISIKLSKTIFKPLDIVEKNMTDIANGKYDKKLELTKYLELNKLVKNFSLMQNEISKREEKLESFNKSLEEKVQEKTAQLNQLNKTLEKRVSQELEKNKEKEKIIFEQSKMASMGEMIGNIAHQWRQPLSIISTAASGLRVQKDYDMLTDKIFDESIHSIENATNHLSNTIDDFRNFFKNSKEKIEFNIKEIIEKNLTLMDSSFKSGDIQVINKNDENIKLYGYPNEFIQAVLNILNNSKDILKEQKKEASKYIFIEYSKKDTNLELSILDSGGGVPQNIIDKVFEPYFTTKHKSQGTGIGLYMTRQIIVDHMHGTIEVQNISYEYESKQLKGANFKITIPLNLEKEI